MDQFGGIMNDIHLFHDYYQKRKHTFGKDAKKSDTYYIHVHCNLEDIYNATVKDVDIEVDVCCRVCLGLGKNPVKHLLFYVKRVMVRDLYKKQKSVQFI